MALLDMLRRSGTAVAAAHVNYHQREEADEEEAWVREYCRQHGIGCHVKNEPFTWTGNFEAAAREWRYSFFAGLVRQYGYAGVMIAHQQDDLIETYIMQKEKGITPEYWGLKESGMYAGMRVERPLLSMKRSEILEYCRRMDVRFYHDATNDSDRYTRNRIRHETVEKLTDTEREMVLREIRHENAVMQERRCRMAVRIIGGKIALAAYRAQPEEDRLTLLRMYLEQQGLPRGFSRAFLKETDNILLGHDDFCIPLGMKRLVQRDGSFFLKEPAVPYAYVCGNPDEVLALGKKESFLVTAGSPGVNAVTVRADDWPLTIRSWRKGDSIRMRFGTKSVHRFFIDRHIPLYQRSSWPVTENCRKEIILVSGLGCDTLHFSVSPDFNVIQYTL